MVQLTYEEMLQKLDQMYTDEEFLINEIAAKVAKLEQLKEDKELLQTMIMYQSNKDVRKKNLLRNAK